MLRLDPARWPLSDESVRRALSLALDRGVLARRTGATSSARARCCSIRWRRRRSRRTPTAARSLLRAAGAEGTLQLEIWAEPGSQARVARAIAIQLVAVGVKVDVRVATASERPASARAWLEWLTPAYGDPAAIFMPLADELRRRRSTRSRSACDARRGSPAMRAAPPSGGSTSASAEAVSERFRCCAQTFPRRSRPCWWGEAPIPSSTSTSPCSTHDHDRTPPPATRSRRSARWPGCGSPWPRTARSARSSARRSTSTSSSAPSAREWRALAEAVVLHVRTTPPSAVPAGCCPALPPPALAPPRVRAARRRPGRRRVCGRGAGRRDGGLALLAARARPSRASCGRPRSSSAGTRAAALDGQPVPIGRVAPSARPC